MRRQFGPAGGPEISVLDYRSQQEKLMPLLASAYGIHFTTRYLVMQYAEAKRTKEEDVIADVHALSAGTQDPSFTFLFLFSPCSFYDTLSVGACIWPGQVLQS